jgi:branched-chain amino acid transport system permease protein
MSLLSGDLPRSRVLTVLLLLVVGGLALAPFLFGGAQPINTAAKVCVFILLVASYDLLIGYTGIVSFAHTMFFGIGGYGVGLALYYGSPTWPVALGGLAVALVAGTLLALLIGLFSLRVRALFYAMITLAVASAFGVLASQLSAVTGGEDGRSFRVPEALRPGTRFLDAPLFGVEVNGRILAYYIVFATVAALFLLLLRIVNSPFGRVLQAIRENEFRAEALGYQVVRYRVAANCIAAALAVVAGGLNALWLRYTGPDTTLSFTIMMDILLMVVIGGMGTLYGAVLGATLFVVAQNYLQKLMGTAAQALESVPVLARLVDPDRWLLWLGVLFVLSVYFFPTGIVGRLRSLGQTSR